jgi:hypothetical protein
MRCYRYSAVLSLFSVTATVHDRKHSFELPSSAATY